VGGVRIVGTPDLTDNVWRSVIATLPPGAVSVAVLALQVNPGVSVGGAIEGYSTRLQHAQRLLREWYPPIEFEALLGIPTVPRRPDPRYGPQYCLPGGGHAVAERDALVWYKACVAMFREAGVRRITLMAQDGEHDWCGVLRADGTAKDFLPDLVAYMQGSG